MKKSLLILTIVLTASGFTQAQNNVRLVPDGGNVCNPMMITFSISGNSFNPVSFQWSTGATTPYIQITNSGTYTLSITGYHGSSSVLSTIIKSETYNVLPAPNISTLTDLWVCKSDTVKLSGESAYDALYWSNGTTGDNFAKVMNDPGTPGTPGLDTMSISYLASISKVCFVKSETVMIRSIRRPPGVSRFYDGRMNIRSNDSIPSGLVSEYLFPVSYEMVFTDTTNPANVITYTTAPGSNKAPANILTPGSAYHVVSTPIINGVHYCHGATSTIGIRPAANNRLGTIFTPDDGLNLFQVYDVQGRLLFQKTGEVFEQEWLNEIAPQILIIQRTGNTQETIRMRFTN